MALYLPSSKTTLAALLIRERPFPECVTSGIAMSTRQTAGLAEAQGTGGAEVTTRVLDNRCDSYREESESMSQ